MCYNVGENIERMCFKIKKTIISILVLLILCFSLTGCKTESKQVIDPNKYSFVNVEWTRKTDSCTETLYFKDNGDCGYYCACGNPVNDDDLCEGFTFDAKTNTINLIFSETTKDTITKILVKSFDDESLVLDFDGDIREFKKVKEAEENKPGSKVTYNEQEYVYLQFPSDMFVYSLKESLNFEEDEIVPIKNDKWDMVYYNDDIFILNSQESDAVAYYGSDKNYKWSVDVDTENDFVNFPITLNDQDIAYIYDMPNAEKETTLSFNDIEVFASLVKISNDGLIRASTSLAGYKNAWYWRSEVIDESAKGWPEFVIELPKNLVKQLDNITKK